MTGAHQGADPAWATDLVAAHRHQVRSQCLHVERQAARHLSGVAVKQRPRGSHPIGDLAHRVEHAGLAVGCHHRHQHHIVARGCPSTVSGSTKPPAVTPITSSFVEAAVGQPAQPCGPPRHAPPPTPAFRRRSSGASLDRAPQSQVVGLGRAGGEHDASRPSAHQRRHMLAGLVHRSGLPAPEPVNRGGIAHFEPDSTGTITSKHPEDRAAPRRCSRDRPPSRLAPMGSLDEATVGD